jgi:hypothetical protein
MRAGGWVLGDAQGVALRIGEGGPADVLVLLEDVPQVGRPAGDEPFDGGDAAAPGDGEVEVDGVAGRPGAVRGWKKSANPPGTDGGR